MNTLKLNWQDVSELNKRQKQYELRKDTDFYYKDVWEKYARTDANSAAAYDNAIQEAKKRGITLDSLKEINRDNIHDIHRIQYDYLDNEDIVNSLFNELYADRETLKKRDIPVKLDGRIQFNDKGEMVTTSKSMSDYEYFKYNLSEKAKSAKTMEMLELVEGDKKRVKAIAADAASYGMTAGYGLLNFATNMATYAWALGDAVVNADGGAKIGQGGLYESAAKIGERFDKWYRDDIFKSLVEFEAKYSYIRTSDGDYRNYVRKLTDSLAQEVGAQVGRYYLSKGIANIASLFTRSRKVLNAVGTASAFVTTQQEAFVNNAKESYSLYEKDLVPLKTLAINATIKSNVEAFEEIALDVFTGYTELFQKTYGVVLDNVELNSFTPNKIITNWLYDSFKECSEEVIQDLSNAFIDKLMAKSTGYTDLKDLSQLSFEDLATSFIVSFIISMGSSTIGDVNNGSLLVNSFDKNGIITKSDGTTVKVNKAQEIVYNRTYNDFIEGSSKFLDAMALKSELTRKERESVVNIYSSLKALESLQESIGETKFKDAIELMDATVERMKTKTDKSAIIELVDQMNKLTSEAQGKETLKSQITKKLVEQNVKEAKRKNIVNAPINVMSNEARNERMNALVREMNDKGIDGRAVSIRNKEEFARVKVNLNISEQSAQCIENALEKGPVVITEKGNAPMVVDDTTIVSAEMLNNNTVNEKSIEATRFVSDIKNRDTVKTFVRIIKDIAKNTNFTISGYNLNDISDDTFLTAFVSDTNFRHDVIEMCLLQNDSTVFDMILEISKIANNKNTNFDKDAFVNDIKNACKIFLYRNPFVNMSHAADVLSNEDIREIKKSRKISKKLLKIINRKDLIDRLDAVETFEEFDKEFIGRMLHDAVREVRSDFSDFNMFKAFIKSIIYNYDMNETYYFLPTSLAHILVNEILRDNNLTIQDIKNNENRDKFFDSVYEQYNIRIMYNESIDSFSIIDLSTHSYTSDTSKDTFGLTAYTSEYEIVKQLVDESVLDENEKSSITLNTLLLHPELMSKEVKRRLANKFIEDDVEPNRVNAYTILRNAVDIVTNGKYNVFTDSYGNVSVFSVEDYMNIERNGKKVFKIDEILNNISSVEKDTSKSIKMTDVVSIDFLREFGFTDDEINNMTVTFDYTEQKEDKKVFRAYTAGQNIVFNLNLATQDTNEENAVIFIHEFRHAMYNKIVNDDAFMLKEMNQLENSPKANEFKKFLTHVRELYHIPDYYTDDDVKHLIYTQSPTEINSYEGTRGTVTMFPITSHTTSLGNNKYTKTITLPDGYSFSYQYEDTGSDNNIVSAEVAKDDNASFIKKRNDRIASTHLTYNANNEICDSGFDVSTGIDNYAEIHEKFMRAIETKDVELFKEANIEWGKSNARQTMPFNLCKLFRTYKKDTIDVIYPANEGDFPVKKAYVLCNDRSFFRSFDYTKGQYTRTRVEVYNIMDFDAASGQVLIESHRLLGHHTPVTIETEDNVIKNMTVNDTMVYNIENDTYDDDVDNVSLTSIKVTEVEDVADETEKPEKKKSDRRKVTKQDVKNARNMGGYNLVDTYQKHNKTVSKGMLNFLTELSKNGVLIDKLRSSKNDRTRKMIRKIIGFDELGNEIPLATEQDLKRYVCDVSTFQNDVENPTDGINEELFKYIAKYIYGSPIRSLTEFNDTVTQMGAWSVIYNVLNYLKDRKFITDAQVKEFVDTYNTSFSTEQPYDILKAWFYSISETIDGKSNNVKDALKIQQAYDRALINANEKAAEFQVRVEERTNVAKASVLRHYAGTLNSLYAAIVNCSRGMYKLERIELGRSLNVVDEKGDEKINLITSDGIVPVDVDEQTSDIAKMYLESLQMGYIVDQDSDNLMMMIATQALYNTNGDRTKVAQVQSQLKDLENEITILDENHMGRDLDKNKLAIAYNAICVNGLGVEDAIKVLHGEEVTVGDKKYSLYKPKEVKSKEVTIKDKDGNVKTVDSRAKESGGVAATLKGRISRICAFVMNHPNEQLKEVLEYIVNNFGEFFKVDTVKGLTYNPDCMYEYFENSVNGHNVYKPVADVKQALSKFYQIEREIAKKYPSLNEQGPSSTRFDKKTKKNNKEIVKKIVENKTNELEKETHAKTTEIIVDNVNDKNNKRLTVRSKDDSKTMIDIDKDTSIPTEVRDVFDTIEENKDLSESRIKATNSKTEDEESYRIKKVIDELVVKFAYITYDDAVKLLAWFNHHWSTDPRYDLAHAAVFGALTKVLRSDTLKDIRAKVMKSNEYKFAKTLINSKGRESAVYTSVLKTLNETVHPGHSVVSKVLHESGITLDEDSEVVKEFAEAIESGDLDRIRKARVNLYAEILKRYKELNPQNIIDKLLTFEQVGMLSSPSTWARNFISNKAIGGLYLAIDNSGKLLDKLIPAKFNRNSKEQIDKRYDEVMRIAMPVFVDDINRLIRDAFELDPNSQEGKDMFLLLARTAFLSEDKQKEALDAYEDKLSSKPIKVSNNKEFHWTTKAVRLKLADLKRRFIALNENRFSPAEGEKFIHFDEKFFEMHRKYDSEEYGTTYNDTERKEKYKQIDDYIERVRWVNAHQQYAIIGTKVSEEVRTYVEDNLINNGLYELVNVGLDKYFTRSSKKDTSQEDRLKRMIIKSVISECFNENMTDNKVLKKYYEFIFKRLSDDAAVRKRTKMYLGKMIVEDNLDMSIPITKNTAMLNAFTEAYTMAAYDFVHRNNVWVSLEAWVSNYLEARMPGKTIVDIDGNEKPVHGWQSSAVRFMYKQLFPFLGASWNWFLEACQLTPAGLAVSIVNYCKLENYMNRLERNRAVGDKDTPNAKFAEYLTRRGITKGVIGTVGMFIGIMLAAFKKVRLDDKDDEYKLYFGDHFYVSLGEIYGTNALTLGMQLAGSLCDAVQDGSLSIDEVGDAFVRTLDALLSDSVYYDLYTTIRYSSGATDFLANEMWSSVEKFVPNFLKVFSSCINKYSNVYHEGFVGRLEKLASYIPGVSYALHHRVDVYTGEDQTNVRAWWLVQVINKMTGMKLSPYKVSDIEALAVAYGVNKSMLTGNYNIDGEDVKVSSNKNNTDDMNRFYGKLNEQTLRELFYSNKKYDVRNEKTDEIETKRFSQMTDVQKKTVIERLMNDNSQISKVYILTKEYGYTYYCDEEELKRLKKLGITKGVKPNKKKPTGKLLTGFVKSSNT